MVAMDTPGLATASALAAASWPELRPVRKMYRFQCSPVMLSATAGSTTRTAYDTLAKGFGPGFNGPLLLAGQAVYSAGEWRGLEDAREGASHAKDGAAYARSVVRLRALNPKRVLFGHDRQGWPS